MIKKACLLGWDLANNNMFQMAEIFALNEVGVEAGPFLWDDEPAWRRPLAVVLEELEGVSYVGLLYSTYAHRLEDGQHVLGYWEYGSLPDMHEDETQEIDVPDAVAHRDHIKPLAEADGAYIIEIDLRFVSNLFAQKWKPPWLKLKSVANR